MKKKMIDGLTTPLTHKTPIHHKQTSFAKIIQSENLAKRSCPHKKLTRSGTLTFQMPFHGKGEHLTSYLSESRESTPKKERTSKNFLLEGIQQIRSTPPPPHDAGSHTIYRKMPTPTPPPNPELLEKNEHSNELPHSKSAYYHSPKPLCFLQYDTTQGKTPSMVDHHTMYHAKN
jgi:hypothetical protein